MQIGPETGIVGMLIAACSALFALHQRQISRELAAKDAEIAWLRSQLDPWTRIAQKAVTSLERLTEGTP